MQNMTTLMETYVMPDHHLNKVHGGEEFHTFFGLNCWYQKLISKFGWMILIHHEGHIEAIQNYIQNLDHFVKAAKCKCNETRSVDKQQDLLIMIHKVNVLKIKILDLFGLDKISPCGL